MEVHRVIRRMVKDKGLGLDGFSMRFFQTCWDMVREDLMRVFHEFFLVVKFEKNLNATFIALISMKVGVSEVKDFGPLVL